MNEFILSEEEVASNTYGMTPLPKLTMLHFVRRELIKTTHLVLHLIKKRKVRKHKE